MPIYNYQCHVCEHAFEENRKISERFWDEQCPQCGAEKEAVTLLVSAPKIVTGVRDVHARTDSDFRDNLKRIKKYNPGSKINVL